MSKHIQFTNGILSARFDSAINTVIPADAIKVTDEVFFQTINETDGAWSLVNGDIVKLPFPPPTAEQLQAQANVEARAYLTSTDWYVTRFSETGVPIPADIAEARKLARESVK